MVTGLLLGLQVSGGLCPNRNGKTVTSRKKFTIWHIVLLSAQFIPDMSYLLIEPRLLPFLIKAMTPKIILTFRLYMPQICGVAKKHLFKILNNIYWKHDKATLNCNYL